MSQDRTETNFSNCPTWEINGNSFPFDLQDVDNMERYEAAFMEMSEEEKALPKDGKNSERLRAYCRMFRKLFDKLLGDGASTAIFGEKDNARQMTMVYESFLEFARSQQTEIEETKNRIVNRFSPNRAQRRAAAKG